MSIRVLELFAGIGGCAVAVEGCAHVVLAIDQDEAAAATYAANFSHPQRRSNLASTPVERFDVGADLWWASPPCQPYTVRGRSLDLEDPRTAPLLRVLDALAAIRPPAFALENVPGFAGSATHARLRSTLRAAGYHVQERLWCPTRAGYRNRRDRFYLLATRTEVELPDPPTTTQPALRALLDPDAGPELDVAPDLLARYGDALATVDADDPEGIAHCFTGAYGRSPVYCGSWLREGERIRRFSPSEILRMLGFPEGFVLVAPSIDKRYKLVGNSLSVPMVRALLAPVTR